MSAAPSPDPAPAPVRLGHELVARGLLTPAQRDWAVAEQQRTGSRLGNILIAAGLVRRLDLGRALAAQWGLGFADLLHDPIDPEVARRASPAQCLQGGWIATGADEAGLDVATADRPDSDVEAAVRAVYGDDVELRFAATTDWDVARGVQRVFAGELVEASAFGLAERSPDLSAQRVLCRWQAVALGVVVVATVAGFALAPGWSAVFWLGAVNVFFLTAIVFKFAVSLVGARFERWEAVSDADAAALDERDLPTYTVLVPVYREANIVAKLITNLGRLDYPAEKLEILLLLEADDDETRAAAAAAHPPETIIFVVVPEGGPRTKPKACNFGLWFASGERLVIYDAEDEPEPDQLRKAVAAFNAHPPETVCIQAALNYFNDTQNVLTRMFTLEYSYWFDYMLPGLARLRLPIPLGGTSNHFRTDALRRLGGWDPFNVTEDADLGIRAAALGYTVSVVNSTTYEEANSRVGNWIRQRSRWIKGYMQTALVHTRNPIRLIRTAGLVSTVSFSLLIGGTAVTFLAAPILWAAFVASLVVPGAVTSLPGPLLLVSFFNLLVGNGLMIYLSMMGGFKRRRYRLVLWGLLNPAYWVLHSIAAYKALWQLATKPHYWEKTLHGLDGTEDPAGHEASPEHDASGAAAHPGAAGHA